MSMQRKNMISDDSSDEEEPLLTAITAKHVHPLIPTEPETERMAIAPLLPAEKNIKNETTQHENGKQDTSKTQKQHNGHSINGKEKEEQEDVPLAMLKKREENVKAKRTNRDEDEDEPLAVLEEKEDKKKEKKAKKPKAEEGQTKVRVKEEGGTAVKKEEPQRKKQSRPVEDTKVAKKQRMSRDASPVRTDIKNEQTSPKKIGMQSIARSPPSKKRKTSPVKSSISPDMGEDDEEEEEEYKWWEDEQADHSIKWKTLEHNGLVFPPPYKPHNVRMLYKGQPVSLSPEGEEIASFFAAMLGTQFMDNAKFVENFMADWMAVLRKSDPGCPIKEFTHCDFRPIFEYYEREKERKKALTKAEKAAIKEENNKLIEKFGWAIVNGRKEKVGNFRVEPPGLFRGRGDHPKTGKLKKRIQPEDITLNLGANAKVPPALPGHSWGRIIHKNDIAWLATWTENINNHPKYVWLAANSTVKGMSDYKKFEIARKLKNYIERIRTGYTADLHSKLTEERQRATAMYFIDKLALRAGNEKGDEEADTVGCCSLRVEHITLEEPNTVVFDFLGKDSIRYHNSCTVIPQIFKNVRLFLKSKDGVKDPEDALFDKLSTSSLNTHLKELMPGLTAKVFRTFNASHTFQEELRKTPSDGTVNEKVLAYNRANREVAVLCNHQRAVTKGHAGQMSKLKEKLDGIKYQRHVIKVALLEADSRLAQTSPELLEEQSDFEDDVYESAARLFEEQAKVKIEVAYQKQLVKLETEGSQGKAAVKGTYLEFSDQVENWDQEKRMKQLAALDVKYEQAKIQMTDKDENKATALGTSKINYIDPRITVAWCHKYDVPVERVLAKTLREKFRWAEVDQGWEF